MKFNTLFAARLFKEFSSKPFQLTVTINSVKSRTLSKDIIAVADVPSYNRSTVDGYAIISKESFDFYNHWYISAIRELLFIFDFIDNYSELAKKLRPTIKTSEAKRSIKTLLSLKLIRSNSKGFPPSKNVS